MRNKMFRCQGGWRAHFTMALESVSPSILILAISMRLTQAFGISAMYVPAIRYRYIGADQPAAFRLHDTDPISC
jgi:hypothetical protein